MREQHLSKFIWHSIYFDDFDRWSLTLNILSVYLWVQLNACAKCQEILIKIFKRKNGTDVQPKIIISVTGYRQHVGTKSLELLPQFLQASANQSSLDVTAKKVKILKCGIFTRIFRPAAQGIYTISTVSNKCDQFSIWPNVKCGHSSSPAPSYGVA